ncbi:hypothetical protein Z946_3239 [Sulfitobacter noctilucicola]|uniref:Acetolactate synthase n=1 Tax=Sulfitobacter noctilucicola TaxID=1342301 RepID=A0A7W6M8M7_9RHOB|nr:DUF6497 family protein [Sulfitobacter noctilucicola]KIN64348.1 hypothetical protein Z946_3239 [Sulfitobacter noctilucicola]MBB4174491.1 hypothetical protein [Sulfitobacter noctilucicola]
MMRVVTAAFLAASPAWGFDVPSGQPVSLQEVLVDTVGEETWLRFRFVAPELVGTSGGVDYDATGDDMMYLCTETAIPYANEYALEGDVIVISMADRATEFGQADPEATQLFEAYRPVDNTCIWEAL